MAIIKSNPTSAGRRFYSKLATEELTKKEPEKSLLAVKKNMLEETHKVKLLFVITVAETDRSIVLSTSKEIKTTFLQRLLQLNMTQTELLTSHSFLIKMEKKDTSLLL